MDAYSPNAHKQQSGKIIENHTNSMYFILMHITPVAVLLALAAPTSINAAPGINAKEAAKIEAYLDHYYAGLEQTAVIADKEGRLFDCFQRDRQPGLRRIDATTGRITFDELALPTSEQLDELEATLDDIQPGEFGCPPGSVPYRRVEFPDIAKYGTLEAYLTHSFEPPHWNDHSHVVMRRTQNNWGGGADAIETWNPAVQTSAFFSLAQVWIIGGSNNSTQTLEAGWQKYQDRTGSSQPVFFSFATTQNYTDCQTNNCYDGNHGGWVTLSSSRAPGTIISNVTPYSTVGGARYTMKVYFNLNTSSAVWYLVWDNTVVGYYTAAHFGGGRLGTGADRVEVGGEIARRGYGPFLHTTTDMGSGWAGSNVNGALIGDMRVYSSTGSWWYPTLFDVDLLPTDDDPACYDGTKLVNGANHVVLRYGGTGQSSACPTP